MTIEEFFKQDKKVILSKLLTEMKNFEERLQNIEAISSSYHQMKATSDNRDFILRKLHEGMGKYNNGRPDEAFAIYNGILELETDADAYYNRGLIPFDENDYIQAFHDFSAAIMLYPSYFQAYHNRGICTIQILNAASSMNDIRFLSMHQFAKRDFKAAVHYGHADSQSYANKITIC